MEKLCATTRMNMLPDRPEQNNNCFPSSVMLLRSVPIYHTNAIAIAVLLTAKELTACTKANMLRDGYGIENDVERNKTAQTTSTLWYCFIGQIAWHLE